MGGFFLARSARLVERGADTSGATRRAGTLPTKPAGGLASLAPRPPFGGATLADARSAKFSANAQAHLDNHEVYYYILYITKNRCIMTKYELDVGEKSVFEGENPTSVIEFMRKMSIYGKAGESAFLKIMSEQLASWSGKSIRFNSVEDFTKDLLKEKILKEVKDEEHN